MGDPPLRWFAIGGTELTTNNCCTRIHVQIEKPSNFKKCIKGATLYKTPATEVIVTLLA
jgi:hypothetical protein